MTLRPRSYYRLRVEYYTPMAKPLGVNVPGSPTSTMVGSAPLYIDTVIENPLAALTTSVNATTLSQLRVEDLREVITRLNGLSRRTLSKRGKKVELVKRILASSAKEMAVQHFLRNKDVQEHRKRERIGIKLFTSLRGALRAAGRELLHELQLPYSMPGLPGDTLPEGAHTPGDCHDAGELCLLCRVFGSLQQVSLFQNYTPPLMDDPDHKVELPHEVNHVFIRTHARNIHRPDGNTLNFNQQYFAGQFVTYLQFPNGLPPPLELGFLLHCLERCTDVGAAKAWGAGKLFIQSYTLERVDYMYDRTWTGEAYQLTRNETRTPLKTELDQALEVYAQWMTQQQGEVPAEAIGEVAP